MINWERNVNLFCYHNDMRAHFALVHVKELLSADSCSEFIDLIIPPQEIQALVFPNPANSNINLQFLSIEGNEYSITISDLMSNLLFYEIIPSNINSKIFEKQFNLDLIPGIYFITVASNEVEITKKFIFY